MRFFSHGRLTGEPFLSRQVCMSISRWQTGKGVSNSMHLSRFIVSLSIRIFFLKLIYYYYHYYYYCTCFTSNFIFYKIPECTNAYFSVSITFSCEFSCYLFLWIVTFVLIFFVCICLTISYFILLLYL